MDKLKFNKAPSEGTCSICARHQKQFARLKKAFIKADDEKVRQLMQYENKISKFKAEKEWLEDKDSSGRQSKKKVLEEVEQPQSNTTLRAPDSLKNKRK